MSEASSISPDARRAGRRSVLSALGVGTLLLATTPSLSEAQSWSTTRDNPALWQVVSIDRTGEAFWPYGREDIAGDGGDLAGDEAATDLRSVYADAQADRLWLRAYVSSTSEPPQAVTAFFFLDSDGSEATGGPARAMEATTGLGADPTPGGYETVVSVRGNGTMLGVWQWNATMRKWLASDVTAPELQSERGVAADPLAIGAALHGYLQVDLAHGVSGLNATCGGTIFVRMLHDGSPARTFGDDAPQNFACSPANDSYGDPVVLRSYACSSDAECPAEGICREGVCLFAYPCTRTDDCRTDEACTTNRCVRVVDDTCTSSADCDGLVCQGASCVACSETGARACAAGLVCTPNGSCLSPDAIVPPPGVVGPGKVEGGAFTCSAHSGAGSSPSWLVSGTLLALYAARRRRRLAERSQPTSSGRQS